MPERDYTYEVASRSAGVPVSTLRYMAAHGTLEIRRVHARRVAIPEREVTRLRRVATEQEASPDPRDAKIAELDRQIVALEAQQRRIPSPSASRARIETAPPETRASASTPSDFLPTRTHRERSQGLPRRFQS